MSTTINYDMSATAKATIPSSEMSTLTSIYIPRVYANISTEFVADTFESLNLGVVDRVETVARPGDKTTYMAFVYFASWNTGNKAAVHLAERINTHGGSQARIVYDDPWYWILLPNKSEKSSKKMDEDKILEEFNRSNSCIPAQEWDIRQEREKEEKKLKETEEDIMMDVEIDEALRKQELETDEKIDILYDMIEDLQVRLLESEKKNKKIETLEKELYNLRTIMLTGQPAKKDDYDYWTRRQAEVEETGENMSETVFEDMDYIPSPPKLVRQTACWYNMDDMPPSPPKLVRQNACVGSSMMTPPPRGLGPRQTQVSAGSDFIPNPEKVQAMMTSEIAAFQKMKKDWDTETEKDWMSRNNDRNSVCANIRMDQMGLVYSVKDEDKNFWCDP